MIFALYFRPGADEPCSVFAHRRNLKCTIEPAASETERQPAKLSCQRTILARRLVRGAGNNACEFDVHGNMLSLLTLTKADNGKVHGERPCDMTMLIGKLRRVASSSSAFCCGLQ